MSEVFFPREIIENILKFADGKTLIQAELVSFEWKCIVDYLDDKYAVWKKACFTDIPDEEFYALCDKYGLKCDTNKWKIIFRNWYLWQFLGRKDFVFENAELDEAASCKLSGDWAAYGTKNGFVHILNQRNLELIESIGPLSYAVEDIHFMNEIPGGVNKECNHTDVVIKIRKYLTFIKLNPQRVFFNIECLNHYAFYKNYVVIVRPNNIINIHKISFEPDTTIVEFITGCRLYSPTSVRAVSIFDKSIIILTDNKILEMRYDVDIPESKTTTIEYVKFPLLEAKIIKIYYNHYIFVIIQNYLYISHIPPCKCEINDYVSYDCLKDLGSYPTALFLYGKIFALGTKNGSVFMYFIKDWRDFRVKNYDNKINVGLLEIRSIELTELENEMLWTVVTEGGVTMIQENNIFLESF